MENQSIDLVALFKFSFSRYKRYASFVIGAMLTYLVLAIVPQVYFMMNAPTPPTTQSQFMQVAIMLVQVFLSLGFTKIMLLLIQDEFVEVADMFNNFNLFLSYFVANFLYGVAIFIGLFLLVIPGIWVAIRFMFFPYYIIEEGVSSFTALQKSYYLSQNLTLELFVFGVAAVFLNFFGMLLFGVGIVFTYPITIMATAVIYKSLTEDSEHIPSAEYRN